MLKIFIFSLSIFFSYQSSGFVVLIDPGHGGSELGAVAKFSLKNSKGRKYTRQIFEKDLSLRLAKKIKSLLDKKFTVYLTRSFDRQISLQERAAMADTVKADLFISVHFNASVDNKSSGFETYYLDNHKDKVIKKVENIENKDLKGDELTINKILIDLVIERTAPSSKKLATYIHKSLDKRITRKFSMKNRDIRPGLFYVLALSKRPGVLIEGGFMTNGRELQKINSDKYLNTYAQSVANGIISYQKTLPKKDLPLF